MNRRATKTTGRRALMAAAIAALSVGCSAQVRSANETNPNASVTAAPQTSADPAPEVANCAIVSVGSPSKFACDGKTYTTFQLAKIREDAAGRNASAR